MIFDVEEERARRRLQQEGIIKDDEEEIKEEISIYDGINLERKNYLITIKLDYFYY